MSQADVEPLEIRLGVYLEEAGLADVDSTSDELDETGHAPASGHRGQHRVGNRVALIGEHVLRAAAEAVGREVASVVSGVVRGLEVRAGSLGESQGRDRFEVGEMELSFGVKATLGAGKAVEALLTASGEATVEVRLQLRRPAVVSAD